MKTYRVAGMTCDGCVRAVTRAIARRAPGAAVSIDLAQGLVKIDGAVADAEVCAAVQDAGFTYEGAQSG
jgi:copper chaperone